ncbi:MAG: trans-2-enoyl-CoA reductase family protein [Lachnospiraceae bacterium]|nr:trans-2-enoyl-CoA reductase family protein [Lachnospiraceae bacterium]
MVVEPKVRGFICITAHPVGCKENVRQQIEYAKAQGKKEGAPKKVLVIGSSTGYGLASRISAAYIGGADTLGVCFEKESNGKRTATPGYYNTRAFEEFAKADGLYAKTINGDAFSQEIKNQVIDAIKNDMGQVDMVVYSLAAPRRTLADGTVAQSCLKTVGQAFSEKTWNVDNDSISPVTIEPAAPEEVEGTVKVMGGEDWIEWIDALSQAGVLADNAITLAYSYIGPELTYPIYNQGTIGQAKEHLYQSSLKINEAHKAKGIKAYISVNKALVTQASSAIPIVPLYFAILYKVMKEKNIHEGCIEQMCRLYTEKLFGGEVPTDKNGMIRLDDWEMREDVQQAVMDIWPQVTTENLKELADTEGYHADFYRMFGFGIDGVDYTADVDIM